MNHLFATPGTPGADDAVISTSPIANVGVTRGEVDLVFDLDWP